MHKKKEAKDWYIAATQYLTAGLAMPFLVMIFFVIIFGDLLEKNILILFAIWGFSIYIGAIYASKYLNKTYIIKDNENIAKIATAYLVVINGTPRVLGFLEGITNYGIIDFVFFLFVALLFYTTSKKYIKNTEEIELEAENQTQEQPEQTQN